MVSPQIFRGYEMEVSWSVRNIGAPPGELGLVDAMREAVSAGKPVLGICVGCQVIFDESEEDGGTKCLGLIGGKVTRFSFAEGVDRKIPHMGWNAVTFSDSGAGRHPYFTGIDDGSHFYFVHSYHCVPDEPSVVAGSADYGVDVCAVVAAGEIAGVQFHPSLQQFPAFHNMAPLYQQTPMKTEQPQAIEVIEHFTGLATNAYKLSRRQTHCATLTRLTKAKAKL